VRNLGVFETSLAKVYLSHLVALASIKTTSLQLKFDKFTC